MLNHNITHMIHVYIYLQLVDLYGKLLGKYTSPVDPLSKLQNEDVCGIG